MKTNHPLRHGFISFLILLLTAGSFLRANTFPSQVIPGTVGVNGGTHFRWFDATDFAQMAAAGVKYCRIDLTWKETEKVAGNYNWSIWDTNLDLMKSYGIQPIFLLVYGNALYGGVDDRSFSEPIERNGFAAYAAAAVAQYDEPGVIWEIYNEQNTETFWAGPAPDDNSPAAMRGRAIDYMGLIDVMVPAMRAVSPNANIVSGGVLDIGWAATLAWFDECFSRGLLTQVDGLGVHTYGGTGESQEVERIVGEVAHLRALIASHGGALDFPLFQTEYGAPIYSEYGGTNAQKEARHAAAYIKMFLLGLSQDMKVNVWYQWRDGSSEYSLVGGDRSLRPVYHAVTAMNSQLGGYAFERRVLTTSPEDHVLVFKNGSQRRIVAWTLPYDNRTLALPVTGGTSFTTTTLSGTSGSVSVVGGKISLDLTDLPIYVDLGTHNIGTILPTGAFTGVGADIGAVGIPGGFSLASGTYTIQASGNDIWQDTDQFHFVYQQMTGDADIIARVGSLVNTHDAAKVGVMMRETLAPNSHYVYARAGANKKLRFEYRTDGSYYSAGNDGGDGMPQWVRLIRKGNTFTAYRSMDGLSWARMGEQWAVMEPTIYVGLAVTSHNNSQLTTAVIDNVKLVQYGVQPLETFDPFSRIEAERHSSQSGTRTYVGGTERKVGDISNGDWILFRNVDFGLETTAFSATVSSQTSGGTLEIRLDSPTGYLAGSVAVTNTGSWANFQTVNTAITGTSGLHDLYLRFTGGSGFLFDLDYIEFDGIASAPEAVIAPGDPVIGGQKIGTDFVQGVVGTGSGNRWPAAETPGKAIDGLMQSSKYLNFGKTNTGFVVTPSAGASVVTTLNLYVANDTEARDPASYELYGTNASPAGGTMPLSGFTLISSGTLSLPSARNNDPGETFGQSVTFNNTASYTSYLVVFPTIKNASATNSMQIGDVQLVGTLAIPPVQVLFWPGDAVIGGQKQSGNFVEGTVGTGSGNRWPAAETPAKAIDGLMQSSKYLNFGQTNTGFVVTPSSGDSIVTALHLFTANDTEARDPASYELYGTNTTPSGGTMPMSGFTLISSGALSLPAARNNDPGETFGQSLNINNTTPYQSYLIIFPTIKNPAATPSMQIGDVQLEGIVMP